MTLDEILNQINKDSYDSEEIITKLISALKRCREQRNFIYKSWEDDSIKDWDGNMRIFTNEDDQELTDILEGKSE